MAAPAAGRVLSGILGGGGRKPCHALPTDALADQPFAFGVFAQGVDTVDDTQGTVRSLVGGPLLP